MVAYIITLALSAPALAGPVQGDSPRPALSKEPAKAPAKPKAKPATSKKAPAKPKAKPSSRPNKPTAKPTARPAKPTAKPNAKPAPRPTGRPSSTGSSTSRPSTSRPNTSRPTASSPYTSRPMARPAASGMPAAQQPQQGPRVPTHPIDRAERPSELNGLPAQGDRAVHTSGDRGREGIGAGTRPYEGRPPRNDPNQASDVRHARPHPSAVHSHSHAWHPVPHHHHYRGWYTRWYCHPWWRFTYSTTVVVSFGFTPYAWHDWWIPPHRAGWGWVGGGWSYGLWLPGYWQPVAVAPMGYAYVPGWWQGDLYVDGYYRVDNRDGWVWVQGAYLDDGAFESGTWMPEEEVPDGYVWEGGLFDGEQWVDGFWRPGQRVGFAWVGSAYDEEGLYRAGYWLPLTDRPGQVWIPGWFDGNTWVEGQWVSGSEYDDVDRGWTPEPEQEAGWDATSRPVPEERPLALPVDPE